MPKVSRSTDIPRRSGLGCAFQVTSTQSIYLRTLIQGIMHRKVVTNESIEPLIGAVEFSSHAWSFVERKAGKGAQRGKESLYDLRK